MKIPKWVRAELSQRILLHTSQAIGGVLTASGVDLPALSHGKMSVEDFSLLLAGVLIQTVTVFVAQSASKFRKRRDLKQGATEVAPVKAPL